MRTPAAMTPGAVQATRPARATPAPAQPPTPVNAIAGVSLGRTVAGVARAMRPRQWIKSVLVPAAPAAAGVLFEPGPLWHTAVAVVTFTAAAAGTYLVNDAQDVESDRRHPTKRYRPVASGIVSRRLAWVVGLTLMAASIAGALFASWQLALVIAAYVGLTVGYSLWLKHVAILELMIVAMGFVLRSAAGGAATHLPLSQWFLIVASFGSLFMVVSKRYAEVSALGEQAPDHRASLAAYPLSFLRQVRDVCIAVTLLAYCLWAFERAAQVATGAVLPWYQLSILPVTLGLLRYALLVERGEGGAPEEVVLRDRPLQAAGLAWLILFALGVTHV